MELYEIEVDGPGSNGKVRMELTQAEFACLNKFAIKFNDDEGNQYHASPFITIKRVE